MAVSFGLISCHHYDPIIGLRTPILWSVRTVLWIQYRSFVYAIYIKNLYQRIIQSSHDIYALIGAVVPCFRGISYRFGPIIGINFRFCPRLSPYNWALTSGEMMLQMHGGCNMLILIKRVIAMLKRMINLVNRKCLRLKLVERYPFRLLCHC